MVKIVNPLGDVKTGRQGEVVYQRKYGEQIRRQASPKRAIASEAQIAHRQLYRAALDWRKQLPLPNRRYLEGYCYSNGIVDSYHIPLAWSRFALKLYLQSVKFVLSDVSITEAQESQTKHQHYETGGAAYIAADNVFMPAQTFTPQQTHTLTRVILQLFRKGSPPVNRIQLYLCDGGHLPIGSELTGVDKDLSGITLQTAGEWIAIDLPPYQVLVDTEYAIALDGQAGNGSNCANWKCNSATPTYYRGICVYKTWATGVWTPYEAADMMFQEWEILSIAGKKTGTLHVRHPALMSVIHKREGATIREYDTLSSLDEEYLTGQVGLDVVAGDTIEATTLPGIKYAYLVS